VVARDRENEPLFLSWLHKPSNDTIINQIDLHDINEILLKVALITIELTKPSKSKKKTKTERKRIRR
jgi:hypothetical protein